MLWRKSYFEKWIELENEIIDISLRSYINKNLPYMSRIQERTTKSQLYMQGSKKANHITLRNEYAHLIYSFMKKRKLKRRTVKQIQTCLSNEKLINSISSYSINRILKHKLGLSFKKFVVLNIVQLLG